MRICDDCFEEYTGRKCPSCFPVKADYTSERCIYIWQVYHSRGGFDNEDQLKEYDKVKKSYKKLTGKELPKLQERVIKNKGGKNA